MWPKIVFLDYQVIDHLYRVENGNYNGKNKSALQCFKVKALAGHYELWMAEITRVEMIIGQENPSVNPSRIPEFDQKDKEKLAIAKRLDVRWLGYPCSKIDDQYSRIDVSLRIEGPEWSMAENFERRIKQISGVSTGDACQIVSLVHGFDDENLSLRPAIQWLVTEDEPLRKALGRLKDLGQLTELSQINIISVEELVAIA